MVKYLCQSVNPLLSPGIRLLITWLVIVVLLPSYATGCNKRQQDHEQRERERERERERAGRVVGRACLAVDEYRSQVVTDAVAASGHCQHIVAARCRCRLAGRSLSRRASGLSVSGAWHQIRLLIRHPPSCLHLVSICVIANYTFSLTLSAQKVFPPTPIHCRYIATL